MRIFEKYIDGRCSGPTGSGSIIVLSVVRWKISHQVLLQYVNYIALQFRLEGKLPHQQI